MKTADIQGTILCGGKSSRFGDDKARAPFFPGGPSLLVHLHGTLAQHNLNPLILSGTKNRYKDLHLVGLEDEFPNLGPLSGLFTALTNTSANAVLAITCDMPLIHLKHVDELTNLYKKTISPTFFHSENEIHPFPGIYPKSMLPAITSQIKDGLYSMHQLIFELPEKTLVSTLDSGAFLNVNTAQEYELFQKRRPQ